MDFLKAVVKDKLFYIVLAVILVVNSAMRANREVNPDLLQAYYAPADSVPEGSSEPVDGADHGVMNLRDSLVAYALTLKGKPYRYAGMGPKVFDCSGFTCFVYHNFHINLPHSSALQAKFGESTTTEEVQKGDLLIFRSPTKGVDRVGHVGMVVSNENGKIRFIHSSTGRGVVVDSLDHHHYQERYMGARKVLAN